MGPKCQVGTKALMNAVTQRPSRLLFVYLPRRSICQLTLPSGVCLNFRLFATHGVPLTLPCLLLPSRAHHAVEQPVGCGDSLIRCR
jgi:hypothetical protein